MTHWGGVCDRGGQTAYVRQKKNLMYNEQQVHHLKPRQPGKRTPTHTIQGEKTQYGGFAPEGCTMNQD